MVDDNKIIDDAQVVKENLEKLNKEVSKKLSEKFEEYKKMMLYMTGDAPIEILMLPKPIENALLNHGCLRVYDLFDRDFSEIKGLGIARVRYLTSRLDQFISML